MAFSAAFTGAILAPVISLGVSRIMNPNFRFPVFPKDVFDEEYNYEDVEDLDIDYYTDETEDDLIIDAKHKKGFKESKAPYKRVSVSFDRLNDYNRRNNKYNQFATTEDSLNNVF